MSDERDEMMERLKEVFGEPVVFDDSEKQPFITLESVMKESRPTHYYRDGTPVLGDELMPAFMKWALLFETEDRIVAKNRTLYGERLSTVFLGLDHNFGMGPPLIFETMLFAPGERRRLGRLLNPSTMTEQEREDEKAEEREKARRYPHDQMMLRYSREREAQDKHETLWLQCIIPPRWRHFLLWTVGRDETWRLYSNEEDEDVCW